MSSAISSLKYNSNEYIFKASSVLNTTCSTAAGTSAKTITIGNYDGYKQGNIVCIKFTNGITSSSSTLNINSLGAKSIYYQGASLPNNIIKANDTIMLEYDGTNFVVVGCASSGIDTSSTFILYGGSSTTNV